MKLNIKSLLPLLTVFFAFAACNEYEDYDSGLGTVYPESIPFGYYEGNTATGTENYSLLLTENADGDSIAYVILNGKEGTKAAGKTRTVVAATDLSYNKALGMLTATAEDSYFGAPATVYVAYKSDLSGFTMSVEYGDKNIGSGLQASTLDKAVPAGQWTATDATGAPVLDIVFNDGASETPDGGTFILPDGTEEAMTYTVEGTTVTATGENGTVVRAAYNAKGQLVATIGGQEYVLGRVVIPEPETYVPVAYGMYLHSYKVLLGGGVFNDRYESILYQSDRDDSKFVIAPFVNTEQGFAFSVDEEGYIVMENMFTPTGYVHPSYGMIYVSEATELNDDPALDGAYSHYDADADIFYFDFGYHNGSSIFGFVEEVFQVTDYITGGEATAPKVLAPQPVAAKRPLAAPAGMKLVPFVR